MKLTDHFRAAFDAVVRSRGTFYAESGRVRHMEIFGDDGFLEAEVSGSGRNRYDVFLDWKEADRGVFLANCSCPHFEEGNFCKHLWAVFLELDSENNGFSSFLPKHFASNLKPELYREDEDPIDDDPFDGFLGRFGRPNSGKHDPSNWRRFLAMPHENAFDSRRLLSTIWDQATGGPCEVWYLLSFTESQMDRQLILEVFWRERHEEGELSPPRAVDLTKSAHDWPALEEDRELVGRLSRIRCQLADPFFTELLFQDNKHQVVISPSQYESLLPALCATGRFRWHMNEREEIDRSQSLAWDDGPAYRFRLELVSEKSQKAWILQGVLLREGERLPLSEAVLALPSGVVWFADRLAQLEAQEASPWLDLLQHEGEIRIPYADKWEFLDVMASTDWNVPVDLPEDCRPESVAASPKPVLRVNPPERQRKIEAHLLFEYEGTLIRWTDPRSEVPDAENERMLVRDRAREIEFLKDLPIDALSPNRHGGDDTSGDLFFPARLFTEVADRLIAQGWRLEGAGVRYRRAGAFRGSVTSNIDWFDLEGGFDYGEGVTATLPELLRAVRDRREFVPLSDGSQGLLPGEWIEKFGALAQLGQSSDDEAMRFSRPQAMLLDALLAAQDEVKVDRGFADLRKKLTSFDGIAPAREPRGFSGTLRDYQKEGLGWLQFLEAFGFGGCLADDMGLGKTIQVLALLQWRRACGKNRGPSLIVVPRSLVFNWIEEAARFTPRIPFFNHTGQDREEHLESIGKGDVLVTTYGTLRRDILKLREIAFDYVILDESQAIKNAQTQTAKATRLLHARHRLAMTGTPVENHLGELWSLFEFLNPGMLGSSKLFRRCWKNGTDDREQLRPLREALAPFLLRRTKEKVIAELPQKTEQTLYCQLDKKERADYNRLRKYYRESLEKKIEDVGLNQSKILVLEALLRLRQAACHRGLLDEKHADQTSAKLETLIEQLTEITAEGHKALVFSQFTQLLALVRRQLDDRGIRYAYLDGRTRKRQERVRHFQEDPACSAFLISLKAGGHGLNLTAADYVFLLDPWWNPAVEAQAIDRAHRIGQQRPVFAYRLIAQDTVEEKILQLQSTKRHLADSILQADGSLLQQLSPEDLQLLLS